MRSFPLTVAACGLPSSSQAYSLNITVVPTGALQFLTIWPTGQTQPFVSTLNSFEGRVVANAAIVPAGTVTGGAVSVFVTDNTDVIIDVNGYFDSVNSAALPFYVATPCRIADTRNPSAPFGGPGLLAGSQRNFTPSASACVLPASAQAFSLNATVVPAGPLSFLTLWPTGQSRPPVSTLNSFDGRIVANAAIVPANSTGSISAFVTDATNLILDTNGYFGNTGTGSGLSFFSLAPCRIADTRNSNGPFGGPRIAAGGMRSFAVPQSACGIPTGAQAYAMNVTAVPPAPLAYLTIWPSDQARPPVSTLNSFQGAVVANAAIVPAAADGSVSVFVSDASDVVLDINGYFAPAGTQPQPDFTLQVTPSSSSATQGGMATYTVSVTGQNGFSNGVLLELLNPPGNQTLAGTGFAPATVVPPGAGPANSTLTVATNAMTPVGTAMMTVRGSSPGFTSKTQAVTLTVNAVTVQPVQVSINNFQFSPTPVAASAGGSVTWTNNQQNVVHQIVADGGQFTSSQLLTGQTFTTMPTTPGTYTYHCGIHPFMKGTVTVQ